MLHSRTSALLSPRKPATPSQLRDRAAWKKTPEVRRSLRGIGGDESDLESSEQDGHEQDGQTTDYHAPRTVVHGISGLPRRMQMPAQSGLNTPTPLSPATGIFERNPTPLHVRSRDASTPSTVTPRRRTLGHNDTAIPHDRYQIMPDEYFLHDGVEASERTSAGVAKGQELLKDISFMQDNIKVRKGLSVISDGVTADQYRPPAHAESAARIYF